MEKLSILDDIVRTDIAELFQGTGAISKSIISICNDIVTIVSTFIDQPELVDMSSPSCLSFLTVTLPCLVEVFFRRKNKCEHEDAIQKMFLTVTKLLAQPGSQEIVELCELRNFLLLGVAHHFKFITAKQVKILNAYGNLIPTYVHGPGFYSDFGRPVATIRGSKAVYFWADEWETELGSFKAVGHFVAVYLGGGVWRQGQVLDYRPGGDLFSIRFDPEETEAGESGEPVPEDVRDICLGSTKHVWVDIFNKARLTTAAFKSPMVTIAQQNLRNSSSDEGLYIRIWWSKYKKFFYGKIVRFHPDTRKHTVQYDDGDLREYDLFNSGKEFEIIFPPADLVSKLSDMSSNQEMVKLVAEWHRANNVDVVSTPATGAALVDSGTRSTVSSAIVPRPAAAESYQLSLHQLALINEYFIEGGSDTMFGLMTDSASSPPTCRVILLHLQLIYSLRYLVSALTFKSLVWDTKDALPECFMRYEDSQIKDLTANLLSEILYLLKELMNLAMMTPSSKETIHMSMHQPGGNARATKLQESIDYLKLAIAKMLLKCSQLQKRYLGLSMIKDAIEAAFPKIPPFVAKRLSIITGTKPRQDGRYEQRGGQAIHSKMNLSVPQVERWLIENNIIDEILGASLHQDLAAKADTVLVLLAHRRLLTEAHIDLLWQAARGAHEAVVRVIYQLIILIIPVLEIHLRMYLFNIISSIPAREFTEPTLQLIKNFTIHALQAHKEEARTQAAESSADMSEEAINASFQEQLDKIAAGSSASKLTVTTTQAADAARRGQVVTAPPRQWLGFAVLWQFVQDPVSADSDVVDESLVDCAVHLLVELLDENGAFKDDRELVMQRCIGNIQLGVSVPVSLQILRKTLATYPAPSKSWFSVGRSAVAKVVTAASQIERLQKQFQLLEVFFADFARYHNSLAPVSDTSSTPLKPGGMRPVRSTTDMSESLNEKKREVNGKRGRTSHLKGIAERLEFLKFVLSKSSLSLSESQLLLVWNALGKGAVTLETLDKLVVWLESMFSGESRAFSLLISSITQESDGVDPSLKSKLAFLNTPSDNAAAGPVFSSGGPLTAGSTSVTGQSNAKAEVVTSFDDNVLVSLFEHSVLAWATAAENISIISRLPVASFCIKLFIFVNIANRALKVEADGSWVRVGQLSGLSLLYRLAVDSPNQTVSDAAMALVVELHHRLPDKLKSKDQIRAYMLGLCFTKLSNCIQSLHIGDVVGEGRSRPTDSAAQPLTPARSTRGETRLVIDTEGIPIIVATPGQQHHRSDGNDDWFDDSNIIPDPSVIAKRVARLILMLRTFIQRFRSEPSQTVRLNVLAGRDDAVVTTVSLLLTDTIGTLRNKVSEHFKEPVDSISLIKANKSSGILSGASSLLGSEKLDKDSMTIRQAKLGQGDSVIARKKDRQLAKGGSAGSGANSAATSASVDDQINVEDLKVDFMNVLTPISWLSQDDAVESSSSSTTHFVFSLPEPPLPIHADMTMFIDALPVELSDKTLVGSFQTKAFEQSAQLLRVLGPLIRNSPHYLDQLLEMLDGYLSAELQGAIGSEINLSSSVWDVLQSLPTHPSILRQVRDITHASAESTIRQLLDQSSPYRLLYTLQIMDSILSGDNDLRANGSVPVISKHLVGWALKFLHLGGVDHLLHIVNSVSLKLSTASAKLSVASSETTVLEDANDPGTSANLEVYILILSLLYRFLHRLLLVDPMYSCWQDSFTNLTPIAKQFAVDVSSGSNAVPAGLVLSSISTQAEAFMKKALTNVYITTQLFSENMTSASSLQAISENSLLLVLGLATAFDDGATVLAHSLDGDETGSVTMERWFRTLCLRISSPIVRRGVCRRVFDACANIWYMCFNMSESLSQEKKTTRVSLCEFLVDTIISCAGCADGVTGSEVAACNSQAGEIFSLMAALQAIQLVPEVVLFSAPPSGATVQSRVRKVYTSSSQEVQSSTVSASDKRSSSRNTKLTSWFINKLLNMSSPSESFHSSKPDETLLGILRVLLVLSTDPIQQTFMGEPKLTSRPEDSQEVYADLITFLYISCLFPNVASSADGAFDDILLRNSTLGSVCQSVQSRTLVYALLASLCNSHEANYCKLISIMNGSSDYSRPSRSIAILGPTEAEVYEPSTPLKRKPSSEQVVAIKKSLKSKPWDYNPGALVKDPGAFVGLSNQGGTCYMNSLLQQLFHTSVLSSGLLQIESKLPPESELEAEAATADAACKDNDNEFVLFQLQVLFGFLKISQKRYYDTLPFCKVFKDYDGEPISLGEQKDINEFAGMLFDKLESNPDVAALLSRTIQGKFVWKTRSTETPYKSDREENFYMITVEVKNKSSLEESLELSMADELFSGDNKLEDPDAGRKVEALRRCTIRTLPPTLIIHLKRFEFDLETMNRKKVNDLLTFPMELNMYPYTEEGITAKEARLRPRSGDLEGGEALPDAGDEVVDPVAVEDGEPTAIDEDQEDDASRGAVDRDEGEEANESGASVDVAPPAVGVAAAPQVIRDPSSAYYQYTLRGVVAHMGAIDSGHYYSFIKDGSTHKWHEFNDRSVLPFTADDIPIECFGGEELVTSSTGGQSSRMRQNNAYLLFYERVAIAANDTDVSKDTTSVAQSTVDVEETPVAEDDIGGSVVGTKARSTSIDFSRVSANIKLSSQILSGALAPGVPTSMSARVLQAVWTENIEFQTDRYLFDSLHFRFLWQLQQSAVVPELSKHILASSSAVLDVTRHSATALARFTVVALRFNIEVVCRARAHACVQHFFQHLENIVLNDASGECAEAVLAELAMDNSNFQSATGLGVAGTPSSITPGRDADNGSTAKRSQIEKMIVQKFCHPWLQQMYLQCPHAATIRTFSKFVLSCIQTLRSRHCTRYLSRSDSSTESPGISSPTDAKEVVGEVAATSIHSLLLPVGPESEMLVDIRKYDSCVTRFTHKILLLVVNCQPHDIAGSEGYRNATLLLSQMAACGYAEKRMLLSIGAVYRLVCSMLTLNPSVTRIPTDDLQHCVELIANLVRSTLIRKSESDVGLSGPSSTSPSSSSSSSSSCSSFGLIKPPFLSPEACAVLDEQGEEGLFVLGSEDLQAFLNRIFLEDAISIGSVSTSAALQHVCWSRGNRESLRILEFIAEKVTECVLSVSGANLAYRPYFRTVSELMLGPAIDSAVAFDVIIPALVKKAEVLAIRQYPNDTEYIYAVLKLVTRVGLSNAKGHACVMRIKDSWKSIQSKLVVNRKASGKQVFEPPATTAAGGSSKGRDNVAFNTSANFY